MATTKLRIYSDKKNKEGECVIYVQYVHDEKMTRFSTEEKILPADWDSETSRAKASYGKGYKTLNDSIQAKKAKIDSLARNAKITDPPINPTGDYIKKKLDEEKDKKPEKDFSTYYEDYIENSQFRTETLKGKKSTLNHLKAFATLKKIKLNFETINSTFYESFKNFLISQELQNSSIGKHIKNLKAMLNYYKDKGINTNTDFEKFKKPSNETDIIVFDEAELNKIEHLYLPPEKLQRARDLLIFGCYTGLRFSDIQNLKLANIDFANRKIKLKAIKTNDFLKIPILDEALAIINKYKDDRDFLPKISNQKFNEYIKEIGEFAKMNEETLITTYIGAERKEEREPKFKLITSHIMRRTFITQSLKKGMSTEMIRKITGHRDYKSFERYIKLTETDTTDELFKAWQK